MKFDISGVEVRLSDADIDRIVEAVRTASESNPQEPWLDADAAAAYLACRRKRIYELAADGRLRSAREGRRFLFRREWLDAVVEVEGGRNDALDGLETHAISH